MQQRIFTRPVVKFKYITGASLKFSQLLVKTRKPLQFTDHHKKLHTNLEISQ